LSSYDVISASPKNHEHGTAWNTCFAGGNSGFQVMGMIEWGQKSKPKKIPRASKERNQSPHHKLAPKIPCRIFEPQKFPERINPQVTSERYQEFTIAKGNSNEDIQPGDKHDGWEIS